MLYSRVGRVRTLFDDAVSATELFIYEQKVSSEFLYALNRYVGRSSCKVS